MVVRDSRALAFATVLGRMLDKEVETSNEPLQSGSRPAAETRQKVADLQRATNALGRLNVVMNAAVLAVTTVLAMKSSQSTRWRFASKLLP